MRAAKDVDEHVSVAVWFVCERVACLDSLGERQCFKDVDGCY